MKQYLIPPSHLSESIALGISQVRDVVSRGPGKVEAVRGELRLAEPCLTLPRPPRAPGVPPPSRGTKGSIGCRMDQGCAWLLAQLLLLAQGGKKKGHSLPINKLHRLVSIAWHTPRAGLNARTGEPASGCVLLKTLSHGGRILENLKFLC